MSQALYRTYRSRGFDEVVGQRHVTDLLQNAIKNGSISHAYLFTGPRGTGKTSVARILAHQINNLPYTDDSSHLDIIEIDAASNRRIDDIRDLREKVYVTPTSATYKVYIIDEVHMLTSESFNALLKTLEEPPAHAVFILATTELHKVPATIVSRTQRFHFRPGSVADVSAHLRAIADKESINIDDEALRLIAQHSEGGFRDSVSLLDQVSSLQVSPITVQTVEDLLGLAPHTVITQVVEAIAAGKSSTATGLIHRLLDDGISAHVIIAQLIKIMSTHAEQSPHLYDVRYELIEAPRSYAPELKVLSIVGRAQERVSERAGDGKMGRTSGEVQERKSERAGEREIAHSTSVERRAESVERAQERESGRAEERKTEEAQEQTSEPQAMGGAVDWERVLSELHKHSPALHSILKRAQVTIDDVAIRLKFTFALHRKKLQDEKNRSELVRTITNLYGSCPEIIVDGGSAELDETSKAVAAIMGGGEAVKLPQDGRS